MFWVSKVQDINLTAHFPTNQPDQGQQKTSQEQVIFIIYTEKKNNALTPLREKKKHQREYGN